MKFNVWTLLFQIINFVVLLVILRRLLYKPVREIMEKRRELIARNMREAERTRSEAQALKDRYETEMNGLKEQKARMLEALQEEVDAERKRLIGKAREEVDRIAAREQARLSVEQRTVEAEIKEHMLDSVSVYSSNLLRDIADETLHQAVFRKSLDELKNFVGKLDAMKAKDGPLAIEIAAAYPLSDADIKRIRDAVQELTARSVVVTTDTDPLLIAGVRMKAADRVFDASLAGQVRALKERLKEAPKWKRN
jgi:F-type H+-transporting ATPase subunit b